MMDFSQGAGQSSGSDLIPNGQLAWAILNVRAVKASKSGGQYIDVELTIDDSQPYARRKIWEMIGDPNFPGNSEEYRQMGLVAISRILESGRGAGPNNPAGYKINQYQDLHGLRVAIKIGISKGKDGYDDKNRVVEWLTPNPSSASGFKEFEALQQGIYNKAAAKPAAAAQTGFGFGGQGNPAPPATAGFGSPQTQAQPAPNTNAGFQQPQQGGANGFAGNATQPSAQPVNANASPSENWLAQANAQ
ncbi:hypothetical protein BSL82_15850 [Tardibacter chloracetimidivorans]|uniref:Uncharacterized protein n=1 Tax=Tardibacter chloracetimidivorans TaxID=1921510 RepID=A0A1L3ZYA5_9SPHN|nr:hypothetical protein [Tardibacter chloracetimidivorans]API60579.1 hypothetical protein BSL82_15850 [Tardibacter chloracetimidivorans]